MAGEKTVIISVDGKELTVKHVTEAKISEELDSDIVKTFDEPVTVPSTDGGFTIDIDALEVRTVDDFFLLKQILRRMRTEEGDISITETFKIKGQQPFDNVHALSGVLLTSNEVTYNAEDLTARSLSFSAKSYEEYVNGQPVKWDDE